jgi:hypothetical protein
VEECKPLVGGALALMQEAGEQEAVIEFAPQCLVGPDRSCSPRHRKSFTLVLRGQHAYR